LRTPNTPIGIAPIHKRLTEDLGYGIRSTPTFINRLECTLLLHRECRVGTLSLSCCNTPFRGHVFATIRHLTSNCSQQRGAPGAFRAALVVQSVVDVPRAIAVGQPLGRLQKVLEVRGVRTGSCFEERTERIGVSRCTCQGPQHVLIFDPVVFEPGL